MCNCAEHSSQPPFRCRLVSFFSTRFDLNYRLLILKHKHYRKTFIRIFQCWNWLAIDTKSHIPFGKINRGTLGYAIRLSLFRLFYMSQLCQNTIFHFKFCLNATRSQFYTVVWFFISCFSFRFFSFLSQFQSFYQFASVHCVSMSFHSS